MTDMQYGATMSDDALRGLIRRYEVVVSGLGRMSRDELLATVNAHDLVPRSWSDRFAADDAKAAAARANHNHAYNGGGSESDPVVVEPCRTPDTCPNTARVAKREARYDCRDCGHHLHTDGSCPFCGATAR